MGITRRAAIILAASAALTVGTVGVADAAYYNGYTTIASTPDAWGTGASQAFAAGSTYLYSVKISSDESKSIIYRVNKSTGQRSTMYNGTSGASYNTWLGHANDMGLFTIHGVRGV